MNIWQKMIVGIVAVGVWVGAIWAHHVFPDIDVSALILAAQTTISGLGITHVIVAKNDQAQAAGAQSAAASIL